MEIWEGGDRMAVKQISFTLPEELYEEVVKAKEESNALSLAQFIRQIVLEKLDEWRWERNLAELQREVRESGGLELGETKEEVIERLRETRRQIFETEYAHLSDI
jgi:metal-responsive CopG/Arc/MetJ family transcriptional regulator